MRDEWTQAKFRCVLMHGKRGEEERKKGKWYI